MKAPICRVCAKTGVLCPADQKKLEGGLISELDVRVAKVLYEFDEKYDFGDVEMLKAVDLGKTIVIFVRGNVARLIGRGGSMARQISKRLGKRVRFVSLSHDLRRAVQDLLGKARIMGISVVYTPEGEKYKIIIPANEKKYAIIPISKIPEVLRSVFGKEVTIELVRT